MALALTSTSRSSARPGSTRCANRSRYSDAGSPHEYVATTGCHRKHATAVLGGKRQRVKHPIRRPRRKRYTDEDAWAVLALAELFDVSPVNDSVSVTFTREAIRRLARPDGTGYNAGAPDLVPLCHAGRTTGGSPVDGPLR